MTSDDRNDLLKKIQSLNRKGTFLSFTFIPLEITHNTFTNMSSVQGSGIKIHFLSECMLGRWILKRNNISFVLMYNILQCLKSLVIFVDFQIVTKNFFTDLNNGLPFLDKLRCLLHL